jgi:hypothetical protein
MSSLSRELRKRLENVVTAARDVAEAAAIKALRTLAVGDRDPHGSMKSEQKALRNRLRAHGRQLGDSLNQEKGTQNLDHLVTECAYEQWHRMLFARFLAENQLLLEPESGVAIAIEEVKELARSRGKDWVVVAGEFAVRMLPQVFRQDDPVLDVQFAPEDRKQLEDLLESLPAAVFTATDSLGWTYQFWQAGRKDAINASAEKIGADELPAVTQLFTEDYMVDFLLDNTLGAWHAGKVFAANPKVTENAKNEQELRQVVALRGCLWKYLRFVKGEASKWSPAAGTFDKWPREARDIKCLDPCMGSGHFVVAMFERLVTLRIAEEKLDETTAVEAVIRDNLFGLEIDPRCTQIAAFNLALAAWRRVGYRVLPEMNLACSGLAPHARKEDWLKLAGPSEPLQRGMERLYSLFKDAPTLGSLINPRAADGDLLVAQFHDLQPLLEKALTHEHSNEPRQELAATALGVAKAAEILSSQFTLVATNVPYLARGKYSQSAKDHIERHFNAGKENLATAFLLRCVELSAPGATSALVSLQTWLFLTSYKQLRTQLLRELSWDFVAGLGTKAFSTPMWDFHVMLISVTREQPAPESRIEAFDVASEGAPESKALLLQSVHPTSTSQSAQLKNPDAAVGFVSSSDTKLLSEYASFANGIQTGDRPRFVFCFWETPQLSVGWKALQSTISAPTLIGGLAFQVRWDEDSQSIPDAIGSVIRGAAAWNRDGVCVSAMGELPVTLYARQLFDENCVVLIPKGARNLAPLWCYCSSEAFGTNVRVICKALKVRRHLIAVPFDVNHWQKVAAEKYPHGLPKPYSSDPTQWLFNGHPKDSDQPLQVAVARLLDYGWPRQTGSSFPDCAALRTDGLKKLAESDGIVCLSAIKGEAPADERLREVLARAYGEEWDAAVVEQLLAQVGFSGQMLTDWLRDGFFEQHCSLFHQRPFIWHIWDGERDGFHALVNYHKLTAPNAEGRKTLEKLTYSYLGDWITRQKAEQKQGKEGADAKLAAALHLQEELKKILEGEPPYDLFVRWKPLHEQAIGWEPDINDGVRINIRPFMTAETLKEKSIFRKAPKIKWDKDRGKEPNRSKRDFPWFWSWDEEAADFKGGPAFDGNRWNDLHYGNEMKEAAVAGTEKKR